MGVDVPSDFSIRAAGPADARALHQLIQELANAQNTPDGPEISADHLANDLSKGRVHAFIAHRTGAAADEAAAGMTLYYYAYSTWQGQYIHMEDLVVSERFRRRGLAQRLIKAVAREALDRNMKRVQWTVLENNHKARALYRLVGSEDLTESDGWHIIRLDDAKMRTLLGKNKI